MKRFTSILLTLGICLVLAFSVFILFTRLSSASQKKLFSLIPFFGKKEQVTFSTRTAVTETSSALMLKTASFDIDFLLHLEHDKGRFIALYPYQVTAGIDLAGAEITYGKQYTITLKQSEITSASSSDSVKVLVLRDSLPPEFLDYDAYFKPLKKAFEQTAIDEALKNGILEKCITHAESFFKSMFSGKPVEFIYTPASESQGLSLIPSANLPVEFSLNQDWKSEGLLWSVQEPSYLSRDELYFTLDTALSSGETNSKKFDPGAPHIRFGRVITNSSNTFSSFAETVAKSAGENTLQVTFSNPLKSNDSKTILLADERGCFLSYTAFKDSLVTYAQSVNTGGEIQKQDYSPFLAYVSMSLNYNGSGLSRANKNESARREAYCLVYDKAKKALEKKNYAALSQYISVLQTEEEHNPDILMLNSLNTFLYKNTFLPLELEGYEDFNNQLSAAYVIKTNSISRLTEESRQKLLGDYLADKRLKQYFEAYFLKYKKELNLTEEEINLYTDDLVMSGSVITRELFTSLSSERRKAYVENIVMFNDDSHEIAVESSGDVTYVMTGSSYEKIYAQKNKGPSYIQKQISRTGLSVDSDSILIFPEKKLFTEYSAIAFEQNSLILFNNITSVLFVHEPVRVPYESMIFYGDYFRLADFTYTDPLVRSVLYQLYQVYSREESYALDITLDLSTQLTKRIVQAMSRPSL